MDKFRSIVFFVISPVLSLPSVLRSIYHKSSLGLWLFVIFMGMLSFLYVPGITNDRVTYISIYDMFQGFGFDQFTSYVGQSSTDIIFPSLIYIFAKLHISEQVLFMLLSMFTVGVLLHVFSRVVDKYGLSNRNYILAFALIVLSISLPNLFSGIRFYFAVSFVVLGLYNIWCGGRKFNSLLLFIVAIFVHFSIAIFLPMILLLIFFPDKGKLYKTIFIVSLVFLALPKSYIYEFINSLGFIKGNYLEKVDVYLGQTDKLGNSISSNHNAYIVYTLMMMWCWFAYFYLIFKRGIGYLTRNSLYLILAVTNLFYAVPTIYIRYLWIVKYLFCLTIIGETARSGKRFYFYLALALVGVSYLCELVIIRNNLEVSYVNKYILSAVGMFFRDITPADFIR